MWRRHSWQSFEHACRPGGEPLARVPTASTGGEGTSTVPHGAGGPLHEFQHASFGMLSDLWWRRKADATMDVVIRATTSLDPTPTKP
eukprot:scaffold598_cov318-Pavlova_lutheri.AAC.37